MNFKDQIKLDVRQTFINPLEMASAYNIDGTVVYGVLTQEGFEKRLTRQSVDYAEGISVHGAIFTCSSDDLPRDPIRGEAWNIDGMSFIVDDVQNRMGVHTVTLIKNTGR